MQPEDYLHGKSAVITGAGRGIGRTTSLALAGAGAHVHLVARTASQLEETARLIESAGGKASVWKLDVTDPSAVLERLKLGVEETTGSPAILINAAGAFGPIALLKDTDPLAWTETIQVNTIGAYLTCRAFVGGMIEAGWGRIINVTSAASLHKPNPLNSAYSVSKVALNHLTRCLASELIGTGVTANVVHPGEVKTDMWADIKRQSERLGPIGEGYRSWVNWVDQTGGDPQEKVADLVLRLVRDDASAISGQFLWIKDGLQEPISTDWA